MYTGEGAPFGGADSQYGNTPGAAEDPLLGENVQVLSQQKLERYAASILPHWPCLRSIILPKYSGNGPPLSTQTRWALIWRPRTPLPGILVEVMGTGYISITQLSGFRFSGANCSTFIPISYFVPQGFPAQSPGSSTRIPRRRGL
jgi:hypothetical protein